MNHSTICLEKLLTNIGYDGDFLIKIAFGFIKS